MSGRWLLIVLIIAVGWGLLEVMLHQLKIGDYAQSPQHLELPEGLTVLVGGGRAGLVFVEAPFLKYARLVVRCKDVEEVLKLRRGEQTDELCGVRVRLVDLVPGGRAAVEVTWGDGDAPEPATPEPAAPEPATPEPAAPEPATPEPAAPESSQKPETSPPETFHD